MKIQTDISTKSHTLLIYYPQYRSEKNRIMKRIGLIFIIGVTLLLSGCKRDSSTSDKTIAIDFTEVCTLPGIGSPIEINCIDDTVYIIDFNDQKVINRIKLSTGENLGREVSIGNGPGEIIPPIRLMITDDSIFVHSMSMQSLLSTARGKLDSLKTKSKLPPASSRIFALDHNEFVISLIPFGPFTETGDARFMLLDNSLNEIYTFGNIPSLTATDQSASATARSMFHQVTGLHPLSPDEFVAVGRYEISLYRKNNQGKYELDKEIAIEPYDYEITERGEGQTPATKLREGYSAGIVSSFVYNGNIYLGFFNGKDDDSLYIKVFDPNGKQIATINPTTPVNGPFAISEYGEIIGLLEEENMTKLVKSSPIDL